jgi:hypothetical protein
MPAPTGRVIDIEDVEKATTDIAEALEKVSEAIRKLISGRLKEEAIIVLIKEALPKGSKLEKAQIKAVLDAAANLNRYTRRT